MITYLRGGSKQKSFLSPAWMLLVTSGVLGSRRRGRSSKARAHPIPGSCNDVACLSHVRLRTDGKFHSRLFDFSTDGIRQAPDATRLCQLKHYRGSLFDHHLLPSSFKHHHHHHPHPFHQNSFPSSFHLPLPPPIVRAGCLGRLDTVRLASVLFLICMYYYVDECPLLMNFDAHSQRWIS